MTLALSEPRPTYERPLADRDLWIALGIGLVTAPVLSLTPILQYMGWFVSSLTHEMGHTAVAWLFGQPSFPAIRLDGHAAAIHGDQIPVLVFVFAGLLAAGGLKLAAGWPGRVVTAVATALYLALAFTSLRETLFLFAGHLGELGLAAVFLWRCATGGFTSSGAERVLYGTLGWYLVGRNLVLFVGLMSSLSARAHYAENGSFGLENDLLRLDLPLPLAAFAMALLAVSVAPLVLLAVARGAR